MSQTYEAIEASANWLNRDQKDVEQVSWAAREYGILLMMAVVEGQQVPLRRSVTNSSSRYIQLKACNKVQYKVVVSLLAISRTRLCPDPCPRAGARCEGLDVSSLWSHGSSVV